MKKLSLLFTLAAIGFITVAFSQNDSYQNAREEVKQYFDSNIFPALEKQQIIYIDKLSDAEKVELRILNEKTNNGSKKVSRQSGNYNRR